MALASTSEPNAILQGGPAETFPDHERLRFVDESQHVVKIEYGNRYEHFLSSGRTVSHESALLRVFEWARCTYVAE